MKQCNICGGQYSEGRYIQHSRTGVHQRAVVRKREIAEFLEKASLEKHSFELEVASALEGHVLNPGDELKLRDGREFKVDINGRLFEVPEGSLQED